MLFEFINTWRNLNFGYYSFPFCINIFPSKYLLYECMTFQSVLHVITSCSHLLSFYYALGVISWDLPVSLFSIQLHLIIKRIGMRAQALESACLNHSSDTYKLCVLGQNDLSVPWFPHLNHVDNNITDWVVW